MAWLGLEHDGKILYQGAGLARHKQAAEKLLELGAPYRCFCTPEELERKRELARQAKQDFIYDRTCLALGRNQSDRRAEAGESFVVRFHVPEGRTGYEDIVHGRVEFDNATIDDFILLRSDLTPTYQLAVVADDIFMGITHVIRGDDHISNTPKQIMLYRALGEPVPQFAHVPLILGPDKKRLSKRHGATSLTDYRGMGFLPEALFNFLALLGWSPGDDREIMGRSELAAAFDLAGINKRSAIFDQAKLEWINGQYISAADPGRLLELVKDDFRREGLLEAARDEAHLLAAIGLARQRCRVTRELAPRCRYFFPVEIEYDSRAVPKLWKQDSADHLRQLGERFAAAREWSEGPLEEALRSLAEKLQISAGRLIHPLRLALTGMDVSPGIFEVLAIIGRDLTLRRITRACERLG